jgi:hypothetical protein
MQLKTPKHTNHLGDEKQPPHEKMDVVCFSSFQQHIGTLDVINNTLKSHWWNLYFPNWHRVERKNSKENGERSAWFRSWTRLSRQPSDSGRHEVAMPAPPRGHFNQQLHRLFTIR